MYSFLLSIIVPEVVKFSLGKDFEGVNVEEYSSTSDLLTPVSSKGLKSIFSSQPTSARNNTEISAAS